MKIEMPKSTEHQLAEADVEIGRLLNEVNILRGQKEHFECVLKFLSASKIPEAGYALANRYLTDEELINLRVTFSLRSIISGKIEANRDDLRCLQKLMRRYNYSPLDIDQVETNAPHREHCAIEVAGLLYQDS